ncbi:MAG: PUA domain-containing protein [Candidatus Helarchaeota archaeon]
MQKSNQYDNDFLFLIEKIRSIARFLFHLTLSESELLFPSNVEITISKKTNRIRYVSKNGDLICTIRPTDGLILFTIEGARILQSIVKSPKMRVIVQNDVSEFIKQGRNVFAKHVVNADSEIRPNSEVIVVNEDDELLAIGKAVLNQEEMLAFQYGTAVKVRHGNKK